MPSPHIISLLPVFRPLVAVSTVFLLLLFTARTASSATQQTRSNSQTLAASSSNLSFGNIQLGNSLTQFETLTNTGDATVTISQATVTGPGFGVRGLTLPTSLGKGQSVTFRVLCTPLGSGTMSGSIAVVSNGSAQALNIPLSAKGVSAGQLTASASAFDFGGSGRKQQKHSGYAYGQRIQRDHLLGNIHQRRVQSERYIFASNHPRR